MRRSWAALVLLVFLSPLRAGEPATVWDRWETAYLGGIRSGHVHTWAVEEDDGGHRRLVTTVEMRLQVRRLSDNIQLRMDNGTIETPAGYVTGVFLRQYLGKKQ